MVLRLAFVHGKFGIDREGLRMKLVDEDPLTQHVRMRVFMESDVRDSRQQEVRMMTLCMDEER